MTDLSFLPSDNLYKFITFCGLSLVIVSEFLSSQTRRNATDEMKQISTETIKTVISAVKDSTNISSAQFEIEKTLEHRDELFRSITENAKRELNRQRVNNIIGIILLVFGFILWYAKLQRFEDEKNNSQIHQAVNEQTVAPKPE